MKSEYIELTKEKFAEIYTNEEFRLKVANPHPCCDTLSKFLHYGTCTYPQRYIVTEEQIAEAKRELQRAKAAIYEKHGNDLLFVGNGWDYPPRYEDDPCNHRISTEFTNKDGKRFFVEFCRAVKGDGFIISWAIDRDKEIECEGDSLRQNEYYNYRGLMRRKFDLSYTKSNLLKLVNEEFDCLFRNIIVDQFTIHLTDRKVICESPKE